LIDQNQFVAQLDPAMMGLERIRRRIAASAATADGADAASTLASGDGVRAAQTR
jgi:hypothetical protein